MLVWIYSYRRVIQKVYQRADRLYRRAAFEGLR